MTVAQRVRRCERGSALIEFAFASPILILLMLGIVDLGRALFISNGMSHAVGEGLRYAKVARTASIDQVKAVVLANLQIADHARISELTVSTGSVANADYVRIKLTYSYEHVGRFLNLPPVTLGETKQIYLPL